MLHKHGAKWIIQKRTDLKQYLIINIFTLRIGLQDTDKSKYKSFAIAEFASVVVAVFRTEISTKKKTHNLLLSESIKQAKTVHNFSLSYTNLRFTTKSNAII